MTIGLGDRVEGPVGDNVVGAEVSCPDAVLGMFVIFPSDSATGMGNSVAVVLVGVPDEDVGKVWTCASGDGLMGTVFALGLSLEGSSRSFCLPTGGPIRTGGDGMPVGGGLGVFFGFCTRVSKRRFP